MHLVYFAFVGKIIEPHSTLKANELCGKPLPTLQHKSLSQKHTRDGGCSFLNVNSRHSPIFSVQAEAESFPHSPCPALPLQGAGFAHERLYQWAHLTALMVPAARGTFIIHSRSLKPCDVTWVAFCRTFITIRYFINPDVQDLYGHENHGINCGCIALIVLYYRQSQS